MFRCCCTLGVAICVQVLLYTRGGYVCLGVAVHGGGYMFRWSKFGQDLLYAGGGYVCLGGPSLVRTCCTLGVATYKSWAHPSTRHWTSCSSWRMLTGWTAGRSAHPVVFHVNAFLMGWCVSVCGCYIYIYVSLHVHLTVYVCVCVCARV